MGRPPKLEPWRVERFMQALSTLAPLKTCCAYAGVTPRAVQRWREWGRRDREQRGGDEDAPVSVYEQFLERYEKTEAEAELRALGHIQLAGQKNWVALAWLLERHRPEDYSRRWNVSRSSDAPSFSSGEMAQAIAQAKREVQDSIPKPRDWEG